MANRTQIKCIILGDAGVGKRSLYTRYCQDTFIENDAYRSVDTYDTTIDTKLDNKDVSLHLLVLGGQEKCAKLRPLFYPQTNVFLLCFDITNRASAENIESKWRPEVWHHCPDMPPIVVVGTKLDLKDGVLDQSEIVTQEEGEELARNINARRYVECSSRSGLNVTDVFEFAIRAFLYRRKRPKKGQRPTCLLS